MQVRNHRRGENPTEAGDEFLSQFAAVDPPIEILRWGEYAARDAIDIGDITGLVMRRAEAWAVYLESAFEHMAPGYRGGAWQTDRAALVNSPKITA